MCVCGGGVPLSFQLCYTDTVILRESQKKKKKFVLDNSRHDSIIIKCKNIKSIEIEL